MRLICCVCLRVWRVLTPLLLTEWYTGTTQQYTHEKGTELKLTAKLKGWNDKPTAIKWYTSVDSTGSSLGSSIATTHDDDAKESQSILTYTPTADMTVFCKMTVSGLEAIKTFDIDVFGECLSL